MNVTITSIHQLEILGNSSAAVTTRVVCSSNVGFTLRDISEASIDGFVFVACARSHVVQVVGHKDPFTTYYGVSLQSVHKIKITDCTFQESYGSTFGVVNSNLVLTGNNTFLNNCRLCSNEQYYWNPDCFGVFASRSNLSFNDGYIGNTNFIGSLGGGIHVETNSYVDIRGNTFFIGNLGRGVHATISSNVDIRGNTLFVGNSGGGVYATSKSNVNIHGNTTFIGNSAENGGGIYVQCSSNIKINGNTTFINNLVGGRDANGKGGGIYASLFSNLIIKGNATFINNSAKLSGGGVYLECASNININGSTTFISNSASGGLIYNNEYGTSGIADEMLYDELGYTLRSGKGGGIYTYGHCESEKLSKPKVHDMKFIWLFDYCFFLRLGF